MSGKDNSSEQYEAEIERLSKLNVMVEIRRMALDVQVRLMDSDINVVTDAEKDLEQLLDWFYNESQDMIAPQQYNAAKNDFGYFLQLIEMAIGYYVPHGYDLDADAVH
jgi:hypothetical protein